MPTRNGTQLVVETAFDFEQILLACLAGIRGGVAPTTPGTGDARLWTFKPLVNADPAPNSFTLEYADSDFARTVGYRAPYGIVTLMEITGGLEGPSAMTLTLMARDSEASGPDCDPGHPWRHWDSPRRWGAVGAVY